MFIKPYATHRTKYVQFAIVQKQVSKVPRNYLLEIKLEEA